MRFEQTIKRPARIFTGNHETSQSTITAEQDNLGRDADGTSASLFCRSSREMIAWSQARQSGRLRPCGLGGWSSWFQTDHSNAAVLVESEMTRQRRATGHRAHVDE